MSLRTRRTAAAFVWGLLASIPVVLLAAPPPADPEELLRFGAEMARDGNWREARFRWERASAAAPDDPRILNNLGVANEVLGDPSAARDRYERASRISPESEAIGENLSRVRRFLARTGAPEEGASAPGEASRREIKGSKTWKVTVRLPVPARLDVSGMKSVLVASFLASDDDLLDVNREAVRFVRSEFRKHAQLDVLDVTPAPAVPEQTLEDLASNAEFWKHLAREHQADLLVSGEVRFRREDASGFREVDVVSPATGQKVRQTKFVEQERFLYEMTVLFIAGSDGSVLFRDRLRKSSTYLGIANDPISAFFDLIGATAADVLGTVSGGWREETRYVFRK